MASVVDQWIEADYFESVCLVLESLGSTTVEEDAHKILDTHTVDGVLDTETIDCVIDRLIGLEV